MYALGHLGLAVACYTPVLLHRRFDRRSVTGLGCVAGLSTIPDVDQYVAAVPHRGLTHTVWFALVVGLAVGVAFALAAPGGRDRLGRGVDGACAGVVAVLAHLVGDVATPLGVRPFAPIYGERLTLSLVSARNPTANRTLFWFGVCVLVAATLADPGRRRRIRGVVTRTPAGARKDV